MNGKSVIPPRFSRPKIDPKTELGVAARMLIAGGALAMFVSSLSGCSDDDNGPMLSQAQQTGVGAACRVDTDCAQPDAQAPPLKCLAFKGGYCGLEGCTRLEDCPLGSACVAHENGTNYCFLICNDKPQCNPTRPLDAQSNCSANITFVGGGSSGSKACVPPS
jgi:hypothetical protein